MELALSLGDTPKPFPFLHEPPKMEAGSNGAGLGFCMGHNHRSSAATNGPDPPVQLDLLPFTPVLRRPASAAPHHQLMSFSWLTQNLAAAAASEPRGGRKLEVKRRSLMEEGGTALSSPNSTASSFQMEFSMQINSGKRYLEPNDERGASSRASDDDENGMARKKLRLTKEQSAFLEESFKEHNTLNPKQKVALAKQLNLRPRQVEVWFQNRRARTKLKQTEVDCEHLKRCCETLTDENRRLQKELQELRALKSSQPFYMQSPATTLTMCPSCERVATTTCATPAPSAATNTALCLAKPQEHLPFPTSKAYQGTTAS